MPVFQVLYDFLVDVVTILAKRAANTKGFLSNSHLEFCGTTQSVLHSLHYDSVLVHLHVQPDYEEASVTGSPM